MDEDRYARQRILPEVGDEGQARLASSTVAIVGCGALGTHMADALCRAGVGRLRIADRDVVRPSNLQRQVLFEAEDAERARPKVVAAAERLARIDPDVELDARAVQIGPDDAPGFCAGADLVLDATDNFPTRLLLNDACLDAEIPWVYVGVIGTGGHVLPVRPGSPPCFRCYVPAPPSPGAVPTCDTAGVLGPAVGVVASRATALGLRILLEGPEAAEPGRLEAWDAWEGSLRTLEIPPDPSCPACEGTYEHLAGTAAGPAPEALCGRDAVQLPPAGALDLDRLEEMLAREGEVHRDAFTLSLDLADVRLTLFEDGRAIVDGVEDPDRAQALFDRLVGR